MVHHRDPAKDRAQENESFLKFKKDLFQNNSSSIIGLGQMTIDKNKQIEMKRKTESKSNG